MFFYWSCWNQCRRACAYYFTLLFFMMTQWYGKAFRIICPLCADPPVTGGFPRPTRWTIDVLFVVKLNKPFDKEISSCQWFQTLWCPAKHSCNVTINKSWCQFDCALTKTRRTDNNLILSVPTDNIFREASYYMFLDWLNVQWSDDFLHLQVIWRLTTHRKFSTCLYHQCGPTAFTWGRLHRMLKVSILDMSLKIIDQML